jgi:tetratricopeptide (TPR) repeat protein
LETQNLSDLEEAIRVTQSAAEISTKIHEVSGMLPEDDPDRARIMYNLGYALENRYKVTKMLPDIEEAIKLMRIALDITTSALSRATYLIRLGQLLYALYPSRKTIDELEEAIRVTHIALTLTPDGPDQTKPLAYLGKYLYLGYWRRRSSTDLDEAIRLTRIAARVASESDPHKSLYMFRLGSYLSTRHSSAESEADLEDSIEYLQAAIDTTPHGHATRALRLVKLAKQFGSKYLRNRAISDLDKAIQIAWAAVNEAGLESQMSILEELHGYVLRKYLDTDTVDDLNELIRVGQARINVTKPDDDNRAGYLAIHGTRLRARYGKTGEKSDLEEAIRLTQVAIGGSTEDEWDQRRFSEQLRVLHCDISLGVGLTSDLKETAIKITRAAVMVTPEDTSAKMEILTSFMAHLGDLCLMMDTVNFSERVVGVTRAAFNITPAHHPARVTISKHLADSLVENFEQSSDLVPLNEAIRILTEAINAAPHDHCYLDTMLSTLRSCLIDRYTETEELADYEDAIVILKSTLHIDANNDKTQSRAMYTLAVCLGRRYEITQALDSLEGAIKFSKKAIELAIEHGDKRRFSAQLGALLGEKYRRTGAIVDLEEAIQLTRTAADETRGNLNKAPILNTLGHLLNARFRSTDSIADLHEAVEVTREVASGTPIRPTYLDSLCTHLHDLFLRTGTIAHLEEAIRAQRAAISRAEQDDPERSRYLHLLGHSLYLRYSEIEVESDLEEAIQLLQEAVDKAPQDSPHKATYLTKISKCLGARHERTGARTDLNKALRVAHAALAAAPKCHPERARVLEELGHRLSDLHVVTGAVDELQKAIDFTKEAVDITSGGPRHANALNGLGLHLAERYKKTGEPLDIEEAVRLTRIAVDLAPKGQNRPQYMKNIALYLRDRYEKTQQITNLNEAILAAEAAVEETPNDHPDYAEVVGTLGTILEERYSRTKATPDLQRAIMCHQSALRQANAQVRTRIEGGTDVLRCCALVSDWQQAYEAVLVVVGLVPTLSLRSLKNSDKQHVLSWAAGLASDAAATALNAAKEPYAALDLLEQSRGLLATSLEEMRTDILSLREKHLDLAEEFARLQGELNLQASRDEAPYNSHKNGHVPPLQVHTSQPYQTDKAFDELLANIRSRPDFASFLLPPSKEKMMGAASNGGPIIVINVSKYRSDAILVERDQIRALALPDLRSHDVANKTLSGNLGAPHVLAWLWDVIAKPVLGALGYTSCPPAKSWPRVWWIPIGPLSRFPLHAAGRHGQGPGEAVIDRVMSSYSSSINALIRGRQRPLRSELSPSIPPRALLVAMQKTPGYAPLRFADAEVEVLRDICKAIPADFVDPGQLRDDIIAQLPECCIFHFAGHGCTNSADPSQSHLLVYDGKITVAALLEMNLRKRPPFLAYLSACGTGRVRNDDFLDESIHLISACQLAGFRHVIGTLWEVNDELCTEMARLTYEGIRDGGMTDGSVCLGLHNASRELRNSWLQRKMEERDRKERYVPTMLNVSSIAVRGERGESEGRPRLPRDIISIDDNEDVEGKHAAFWIPYIHFGV